MEIMKDFKTYFTTKQLVCPHVLKQYSEAQIWSFFDKRILETLAVLRTEIINKPMVINTSDGSFTQRGLRCNCCDLVRTQTNKNNPYLSAHVRGSGIDFVVPGTDSEQVRQLIAKNKDLLPYPIRLESGVTWVHVDVDNFTKDKIQYFKG